VDTKTLFTVVLVAGIVGGFALNNSLFNATIEVGAEAPDFTLMDPDGNEFSLSDFEGEKVIVKLEPLKRKGIQSMGNPSQIKF